MWSLPCPRSCTRSSLATPRRAPACSSPPSPKPCARSRSGPRTSARGSASRRCSTPGRRRCSIPPHIHCIVTGGGLSADGTRWVPARPGFLFPVRILARVFRGKLLRKLEQALAAGTLRISEADPAALLRQAARPGWVVYGKPPFAGPEQVLRYLARYTHRIAVSNERLVGRHNGQVTFQWTDRAPGDQRKLMPLAAVEFLRRFLLHVLPAGLVRIRHYGLLANGAKQQLLPRCRELLGVGPADEGRARDPEPWAALVARLTGRDPTRCPVCRTGHLIAIAIVPPLGPLSGERTTARAP